MKASRSPNQTTVYQSEHGIVAVGSDRSCVGYLVADIRPGMRISHYVAKSPALRLSGQGSEPVDSVVSLSSLALNHFLSSMRQEGNLDAALQGWSRSEQLGRLEAEEMIAVFCQTIGESARAVFRFSLRDNTVHSRAENVDDKLLLN